MPKNHDHTNNLGMTLALATHKAFRTALDPHIRLRQNARAI
jgi:hypothetical protein